MKRTLIVAMALTVPGTLSGQIAYLSPAVTPTGIIEGRNTDYFLTWQGSTGVSTYDVRLLFDPARIEFVSASAATLAAPTVTILGPGAVRLQFSVAPGSGSGLFTTSVARVSFTSPAGALSGGLVRVVVDALLDNAGADQLALTRTQLADVCQADYISGDMDGNRLLNSRDALVILTASVGLDISAFEERAGDVDGDLLTTPRDALFVLSRSVGVPIVAQLLDKPIPLRCAPRFTSSEDLSLYVGGEGTEASVLPAGDTMIVPLGITGLSQSNPLSWAPDGSRFAFTRFVSGYSNEIQAYHLATGRIDTLSRDIYSDERPSWSSDGTRIAYVGGNPRGIRVINADGSGQTLLLSTYSVSLVAWRPGEDRIMFAGYTVCCTSGLYTFHVDSLIVAPAYAGSELRNTDDAAWSPDGSSIIHEYAGGVADTVRFDPAGTPGRLVDLQSLGGYVGWGPEGPLVRVTSPLRGLYLYRPGGRVEVVEREGQGYLAYTNSDLVYVDTVTVAPTLSVFPDQTAPLSVVVANNDGSAALQPVTWTSRDPTIAFVDGQGNVTGNTPGVTWVVASVRGWRSDSTEVTVELP